MVSLVIRVQVGKISCSIPLLASECLLCAGVSVNHKKLRGCLLLSHWMICCVILIIYYSGYLTSHVVSPRIESGIKTIAQLHANNYTMVGDNHILSTMKKFVRLNTSTKLTRMMKSFLTEMEITDKWKYTKTLTLERRAVLLVHSGSPRLLDDAYKFIQFNKIPNKKCQVVEEKFTGYSIYMALSSLNSRKLQLTMESVMEMGIFDLWYQEFVGILLSTRVQERPKMLNILKGKVEKEPQKLPLAQGKLKNVFVLLATCVVSSIVAFILEEMLAKCSSIITIANLYILC